MLLFSSCSEFTENQQALVDKKWHLHEVGAIEFKSDQTYIIHYGDDSTKKLLYEFIEENKISISDPKTQIKVNYFFRTSDSILILVPIHDSLRQNSSLDTSFYHLNPKYEEWETRELFYFGKIISDKDTRVVPYVYFEF